MSKQAAADGVGGSQWRVGDRVKVNRGECGYWGHDSQWAPNGTRGTVDGSWVGHPGGDGEHHVAVTFKDGHVEVASLIFKADELELVRRAREARGEAVHLAYIAETIVRRVLADAWQARCSTCRWEGAVRFDQHVAQSDADRHQKGS